MATIKIQNARLSFPSLFRKSVFEGSTDGKYEATFIIPKEGKGHLKIAGKEVTGEALMGFIDQYAKDNKLGKLSRERLFVKDGDDLFDLDKYPEYEGHWVIKGSNTKRPTVLNRDRTPVTEDDEVFYAGCYVNAIIEPWAQNNNFGKRVNSNLLGVQFVKDGEPFGDGGTKVTEDDFDDIEDEEL